VWARVKEEAIWLDRMGNEVRVFSSNFVKGSDKLAKKEEEIGGVRISRFPGKILGGEGFMKWNFEDEALKFEPDVIIAHSYRLPHTLKALKISEILRKKGKKCKVFLVAHAPFERNSTRSLLAKLVVWGYDNLIGPRTLNRFDKILAITHWEIPYLIKYGARKEKIEYVPNGIPEEFFSQKPGKEQDKILFLGRISPIKNIEVVISALRLLKNKRIIFEVVGPPEEDYLRELKSLVGRLGLRKRVVFSGPVYDIKTKIKKIDSANIFVLPSRSEGMPQSLIEAMARRRIVIASDNLAARDLIKNNKTGYLFKNGDVGDLVKKINFALKNEEKNKKVRKGAKEYVKQFRWNRVIKKLNEIITNNINLD